MADISITGPVVPDTLAFCVNAFAAVAIAAGKVCYINSSGLAALADSDLSAAGAEAVGVAVNTAGIGEPVTIAKSGTTITQAGTTFTKGIVYFVSNTAGGIAPQADIGAGDYVTSIGVASSTSALKIQIQIGGFAI
jgi:hypothetical protein